ncbi:MAG: tetraacyldisaccharide 4'-kinase, partial [Rhizomicrobium sp.]
PLGLLYGASVAWKARHASPLAVRARVICIGNLTAGGSGKTPVALVIGSRLQARYNIFFLTRGYGGRERGPLRVEAGGDAARFGDEALLLARMAPTIVARDRAAGAALAVAQGATAIVMDDGHQNFSLVKNLSIVVVDGEYGFGNGLMIPAGPLRETVPQGLARADAVIVMGDGSPDLHGYRGPVLRAKLVAEGEEFRGRHVFAFAGIGRPEKFVASLEKAGAIVTGTQFFADHHPYRDGEISALKARAGNAQIVTTEKDLVRLSPPDRAGIAALPVRAIFDDAALLDQLLGRLA